MCIHTIIIIIHILLRRGFGRLGDRALAMLPLARQFLFAICGSLFALLFVRLFPCVLVCLFVYLLARRSCVCVLIRLIAFSVWSKHNFVLVWFNLCLARLVGLLVCPSVCLVGWLL